MNKSIMFKQAHIMTKQDIQTGDNYQATFSQSLKMIKNAKPKVGIKISMNYFK